MTTLFCFLAIWTAIAVLTAIAEAVLEISSERYDMHSYRVLSTIDMYRRTRGCN